MSQVSKTLRNLHSTHGRTGSKAHYQRDKAELKTAKILLKVSGISLTAMFLALQINMDGRENVAERHLAYHRSSWAPHTQRTPVSCEKLMPGAIVKRDEERPEEQTPRP